MALYRSPGRSTPRSDVPELPAARPRGRAWFVGWTLVGAGLPFVVSAMMVPVRGDIDRSTASLVLVLPVVVVAVRGGRVPAAVSALVAPLSFDVLLTRPYHRVEIELAADVEAAVILLVVGLTVAVVVSDAAVAGTVASARAREVRALERAIAAVTHRGPSEASAGRFCEAFTELLELRSCRWAPGYRGAAYPVLVAGGEVAGGPSRDRAPLPPAGAEIPVLAAGQEIGRFIVVPASERPVSREERLVAVTIADLFGRAHGDV